MASAIRVEPCCRCRAFQLVLLLQLTLIYCEAARQHYFSTRIGFVHSKGLKPTRQVYQLSKPSTPSRLARINERRLSSKRWNEFRSLCISSRFSQSQLSVSISLNAMDDLSIDMPIHEAANFDVKLKDNEDTSLLEKDASSVGNRKTRKKSNKSSSNEVAFWVNESDEVIVNLNDQSFIVDEGDAKTPSHLTNDRDCSNLKPSQLNLRRKSVRFTVRGKPRPLIRHRSSRGFLYNPSKSAQESFRDALLKKLPDYYHPTIIDEEDDDDSKNIGSTIVLFPQHEFLHMSIKFRMKRPKSHFVGSKPGPGRIKPTAPKRLHTNRTDIDNLAKFVMDSLNGVLYEDDRQIASLTVVKILDSEGLCQGATDVSISVIEEEDLEEERF